MRKLMWFVIGLAAAFVLTATFFWESNLLLFLGISLAAAILLWIPGRWFDRFEIAAVIGLGLSAGFLYMLLFQTQYVKPITAYDGETVPLTIRADTFSEQSRYSMMVDGTASIEGKNYKVRIYLEEDREIGPGDILEGSFRLRLTIPGGQKESAYYQGKGFFLVASQKGDMTVTPAEKVTLRTFPVHLSRQIRILIQDIFPEDVTAFAKALLLGDTTELDYETDTALKVSGIRHIAAVSGLHVAILYGAVMAVFRRRGVLSAIISVVILSIFAAAAGFTPSVTRACIMTGVMGVSYAVNREYDSATALAFACLCMLLWNPFAAASASLQLSVASVSGILMFANPLNQWFRKQIPSFERKSAADRLTGWITASVSVTLSAMVFTTPISIYYFGMISLIGFLTNLLTIWIISFIFIGIILCCMAGAVVSGIGMKMAAIVAYPIRYVLFIAKLLSRVPFAAVYTQSGWILSWFVLCYILLAVFLLNKRKWPYRFLCAGLCTLVVAISVSCISPEFDECRITVVSVGEGQCILIQSRGEAFLVDCGGDLDTSAADRAAAALLSQGVFELRGAAVTHYDRDHTGALANLAGRIDIEELYLPQMEDKGFTARYLETRDTPVSVISETVSIPLGNGQITFFRPGTLKTENENCMCVLFETENCVILITGDRGRSGEKHLLEDEQIPDVDILIAGHHGSKNSTSEELLAAVRPETVIISCGAGNSYGHPSDALLERLEKAGCTILRTDTMGTITIRR